MRIIAAMAGIDPATEMPVVTGNAQCAKGLMNDYGHGYSEVTFSRLAALTGAREGVIHKEFYVALADPKLLGVGVGVGVVKKLAQVPFCGRLFSRGFDGRRDWA